MPSTHRTVSGIQVGDGPVIVDDADLKAKNFQPEPWSGDVGSFTNVSGVAYQNGNGEIELFFVGTPASAPLADVCTSRTQAVIRPMIAQPGTVAGASAVDTSPWVPDAPTLAARNLTLQPIHEHPFDGTLIVEDASGTPTLVAFYRGAGRPVDVCGS